jgi:hypothetical protein
VRQSAQPFAHSAPVLFRLALHGWRSRILDLDPIVRSAEPIGRAEPLRHDAFTSELTSMMEQDQAFDVEMFVERDAGMLVAYEPLEQTLAILQRSPP